MSNSPVNHKPKASKGRVFENPVLEFLSLSSPYIIWGMYTPMIAISFYLGLYYSYYNVGFGLLISLLALAFWTLAEYFLHRYVFHFVNDNKYVKRFHHLVHGYHHQFPKDSSHLFMPPLAGMVLAGFFFSVFYVLMQEYAYAFFPGFVLGYLIYSTFHYLIHTVNHPPKPFRKLWQHHLMHHYKSGNHAYGVSSMFWDRIFNTMPTSKHR